MTMLKSTYLTLLYIIALFHEVQLEKCQNIVSIVALSEDHTQTTEIIPGKTKRLIVSCSVNGTKSSERQGILHLLLKHKNINKQESIVGKVAAEKNITEYGAVGFISEYSNSSVTRTFDNPGVDKAGSYECEIHGEKKPNLKWTCSDTANISAVKSPNCSNIISIVALSEDNTQTTEIIPGKTKRLIVSCSVNGTKSSEWLRIFVLLLKHQHIHKEKEIVGKVAAVKNTTDNKADGFISEYSNSIVNRTFDNPGEDQAGNYECEIQGRTKTDQKWFCSDTAHISAVKFQNCSKIISFEALSEDKTQTTEIIPGETKQLIVSCSVNGTISSEWQNIDNLILKHTANAREFIVGQVDAVNNKTHQGAVGFISKYSNSVVTRTFDNPGEVEAGSYECEIKGKPKSNPKLRCSDAVQISSKKAKCSTTITIEAVSKKTQSKTTHIQPAVTKTLTVNCSIDLDKIKKSGVLKSISLHHFTSESITEGDLVAKVEDNYREYDIGSGIGHGDISNEKKGYLSVQWKNPNLENAGNYMCRSFLDYSTGENQTCDSEADISAVPGVRCNNSFTVSVKLRDRITNSYSDDQLLMPGITKYITINCTLNDSFFLDMNSLHTINLLHSNENNNNFQVVASVKSSSNPDLKKGLISNTSASYLYHTLTNPGYQHNGTYKCEAVGRSIEGKEQKCSVSTKLFSVPRKVCSTKIRFQTWPKDGSHVTPGLTEKLAVNCSVNFLNVSATSILKSLTLRRYDSSKLMFPAVACIQKDNKPIINDSEAVGMGNFIEIGESYIYVEWSYPNYKETGSYLCTATGLWHPLGLTELCYNTDSVYYQKEIELQTLTEQLVLILRDKWQLLDANKKLIETVNLLKGIIEKMDVDKASETKKANAMELNFKNEFQAALKNLFHISKPYKERRYYLAKSAALVFPQLAQETCAKYKGYLAEIDDGNELMFVRAFLKTVQKSTIFNILISGSDEFDEGQFVYARNNTVVKYLPWGKDQPDGNQIENCLYLRFDSTDWNFFDTECVRNSADVKFSYLCEIEEK